METIKEPITLDQMKDCLAVEYGYSDYQKIDNLEIDQSDKDAIKVSILEIVVKRQSIENSETRSLLIASANEENNRLKERVKECFKVLKELKARGEANDPDFNLPFLNELLDKEEL